MIKYEYKSFDLSPPWTIDNDKKQTELTDRLNKLGKDGCVVVSLVETLKYTICVREIP